MSDFPEQLTEMTEEERREALRRYELIGPYLEGDCSQVEVARNAGVPLKTLQRWVRRYRAHGLRGLGDLPRSRLGVGNSLPSEERLFIEGLALRKPKLSKATIHRQVCEVARKRGWPEPSYRSVCRMTQLLSRRQRLGDQYVAWSTHGFWRYGRPVDRSSACQ